MASMEPATSQATQGSRRRGTVGNVKETGTEDQALNMIAKEAEVRLAAKRAARAEARSIRMKEIEREQKEAGDDEETDVDTTKEKRSSLPRRSTLTEREHISAATTVPAYDVLDTAAQVSSDKQIAQLKGVIKDGEAKYKKAMVNAAQLDNERQALQYQVEILRDTVEELQEKIENTDDELLHKTKEYNKLSREHQNTSSELEKCMFIIKERERILDEHGINIDGTVNEGYDVQASATHCSLCSASLNDDVDNIDNQDRGSLLAEIASLRSELEDLKQTSNSDISRKSMKTEHIELDQSFADVSNEAAVIRDNALHTGLYVNNNEKNDDFEMIDNGSQQGGIRHFEDQSFEKSTSSLASSMMTDAATSIESSLPLEINVDSTGKAVAKDDYDIVHVEDSNNKSVDINVDSYTNVDYIPSISSSSGSVTSSNININKYLFDDPDDTLNDDGEHYSVFNVNRYFGAETTNNSNEESNRLHENNELQTSVDTITNVQSDYDTIDTEDVYANVDNQIISEENRDSPYEDVQEESVGLSRSSDGMVIIEESKTLEKNSFDETYVEPSDMTLLNGRTHIPREDEHDSTMTVLQTHVDTDFTVPSTKQFEATVDVISPMQLSPQDSVEQIVTVQNISLEMSSPNGNLDIDMDEKLNEPAPITSLESQVDVQYSGSISHPEVVCSESPISVSREEENNEINISPDSSMNTAFCADIDNIDVLPAEQNETIRNDVEELYNLIAEETNESIVTTDGLSDKSESNMTTLTSGGEGDNSVTSPELEVETPEIKVVDTEPTVGTETIPKAKERKSKKKKKKGDKITAVNVQESDHSTVMPSDPLLLGFATEPDSTSHQSDSPKEKHVEKPVRPKSDIPKQFLDASADLIGNSSSDISDLEDGYISEDGKRKSSKRSKKEGCKSQ